MTLPHPDVAAFLFDHFYTVLQDEGAGVPFLEEPRYETYGSVVIFADLYGNKFDLIQRTTGGGK